MAHFFLRNSTVLERVQDMLSSRSKGREVSGPSTEASSDEGVPLEVVLSPIVVVLIFVIVVVALVRRFLAEIRVALESLRGILSPAAGTADEEQGQQGGEGEVNPAPVPSAGVPRNLSDNEILLMRQLAAQAAAQAGRSYL